MLTINPITNVKNTINKNISFKSGLMTNYRTKAVNYTTDVKHEGSLLADFLGTVKESPLFQKKVSQRQEKIEKGLDSTQNKINALA